MSGGTPVSISGKADVTLTTDGDTLYYNSGRQRLAKGTDDQVLTLASGLPSWATTVSGDVNMKYLTTVRLSSSNNVLEMTTGLEDYDVVWISYYLEKSNGNLVPDWNCYIGGSMAHSLGVGESINGGSMIQTNGATVVPLDANTTVNNNSFGNITINNSRAKDGVGGGERYGGAFGFGQLGLGGTSNAPAGRTDWCMKFAQNQQVQGFKFRNSATTANTFATNSFFNVWVGRDIT
jgi:hypothetical protein